MALSSSQFSAAGGAVSDLFGGLADLSKASGSEAEAKQYDLAAALARQNEQFSKTSTEIKEMQQSRQIYQGISGTEAAVAGAGFAASGSALDILRDSASQGALTKAVIGQQGKIEQAGYEEQAKSYDIMAQASRDAASGDTLGAIGKFVGTAINVAAVLAL